jgi:phosphoribosylamine-glycine ligase
VLDVVATAPTIGRARAKAYEAAALVSWPGMQYRSDIAALADPAAEAMQEPSR